MPTDITNLGSILVWIVGGVGAPAIVGAVVSYLSSNFQWWADLPSLAKTWIPFLASILLALAAYFLLQNNTLVEQLTPIVAVVISASAAYTANQATYQKSLSSGYGKKKTVK